ncbi:unnamed protein product [Leptosia nina]|uniref:Uncharacterized protein n=1 Tax=Leptosia nina TaxID=320188 RepID=A0AAV1JL33_9NEOP
MAGLSYKGALRRWRDTSIDSTISDMMNSVQIWCKCCNYVEYDLVPPTCSSESTVCGRVTWQNMSKRVNKPYRELVEAESSLVAYLEYRLRARRALSVQRYPFCLFSAIIFGPARCRSAPAPQIIGLPKKNLFFQRIHRSKFRLRVTSEKMLALLAAIAVGVAAVDQSEPGAGRPMSEPEVVVQLKYDGGELDRIYLTQFRKEQRVASVPARPDVCADLCHSGLGGEACGSTCLSLMPVGLKTALKSGNASGEEYGQPRVAVCPTLCENQLGEPLCDCTDVTPYTHPTNWTVVCQAFCDTDGYLLSGCPTCETPQTSPQLSTISAVSLRLDTSDGWRSWCNVQCRQGQGGAACNCDRTPF